MLTVFEHTITGLLTLTATQKYRANQDCLCENTISELTAANDPLENAHKEYSDFISKSSGRFNTKNAESPQVGFDDMTNLAISCAKSSDHLFWGHASQSLAVLATALATDCGGIIVLFIRGEVSKFSLHLVQDMPTLGQD